MITMMAPLMFWYPPVAAVMEGVVALSIPFGTWLVAAFIVHMVALVGFELMRANRPKVAEPHGEVMPRHHHPMPGRP